MEVVKDENERVPLLDEEAGALRALTAILQGIEREKIAFESEVLAKRLGVHPSRLVAYNTVEKWISIKPEAPKAP